MLAPISMQGLTKYYGKNRGIEEINLTVTESEVFGFIGPNGAGKTTTIRTLMGLIRPTRGEALIFGRPIPQGGGAVYEQVGYLPGEVNYYPEMTGRELINYAAGFYAETDQRWIKQLIERLQFDPSRRIRAYSMGNRKKLGIIQALLHRPRLVVLDEPTSGLDPLSAKNLPANRGSGTRVGQGDRSLVPLIIPATTDDIYITSFYGIN